MRGVTTGRRLGILLGMGLSVWLQAHAALTTVDIVSHTVSALPDCLHYRVRGLCFWGVIKEGAPRVESTLWVAHYLPEAVVSVFSRSDNNPWVFARKTIDALAYPMGDALTQRWSGQRLGHGVHGHWPHDHRVRFLEADVIGHPLAQSPIAGLPQVAHPSKVEALVPYFVSMHDAIAWRFGMEGRLPSSWQPIAASVGSWGTLYPREGFVVAANETLAAGVVAFRAGHIASQLGIHVGRSLPTECGVECDIQGVDETVETVLWQPLYPSAVSQCCTFGEALEPQDLWNNQEDLGQYAWVLWRLYDGCIQHPTGRFLTKTG